MEDLQQLLARQDGLLTRAQAVARLGPSAVRHRLRPGGPWQRALPAVYVAQTGPLSPRQLLRVALLHAGPDAQLTGPTAVRLHGLQHVDDDGQVHVLVPHRQAPRSCPAVRVHRSHLVPRPVSLRGLPVTPVARAVLDACRGIDRLVDVRALVAEAVQRGLLRPDQLDQVLAAGHSAGSALFRQVLSEVADGVRSAPEAELRALFATSHVLPAPLWNCRLLLRGRWLADPDAYLADAGLVVESDSRAWHLSPQAWEATMARSRRMEAAGLHVLHVSPREHRRRPAAVLAEVEAAYLAARRGGPPPDVSVLRRSA